MLDVLCPLITESDTVSNELLDIILINIVEPHKTQRKNAYFIAKELITKTTDTLEPYIQAVSVSESKSIPHLVSLSSLVVQSNPSPGKGRKAVRHHTESL